MTRTMDHSAGRRSRMAKWLDIDIIVEDAAWQAAFPETLEALVETALEAAARAQNPQRLASLCVLLTSDAAMQALNRQWRDQDHATNVLSFSPAQPSDFLGDLALGHGVIAQEAAAQGKPLEHHLQHLLVHGYLHLLGHDHAAEAEAMAMEAIERRVMQALGAADPYAQEHESH